MYNERAHKLNVLLPHTTTFSETAFLGGLMRGAKHPLGQGLHVLHLGLLTVVAVWNIPCMFMIHDDPICWPVDNLCLHGAM